MVQHLNNIPTHKLHWPQCTIPPALCDPAKVPCSSSFPSLSTSLGKVKERAVIKGLLQHTPIFCVFCFLRHFYLHLRNLCREKQLLVNTWPQLWPRVGMPPPKAGVTPGAQAGDSHSAAGGLSALYCFYFFFDL